MGDHTKFYEEVKLKVIYEFVRRVYGKRWDDVFFKKLIHDIFELDMKKKMKELSKGMKSKFALALALSHRPELLILDEPTSGLDPIVRDELLDVLYEINKENGTTIFFSSHITDDMERISEKIIYIDHGEIKLELGRKQLQQQFKKINVNDLQPDARSVLEKMGVRNKDYIIIHADPSGDPLLQQYSFENVNPNEVLLYIRSGRDKNVPDFAGGSSIHA